MVEELERVRAELEQQRAGADSDGGEAGRGYGDTA